jgi:hypothetical protein
MTDALRHFPARPLTPTERGLVAQWLAGAGDVATAYISNRRTDDPALHHRIVVFTEVDDGPTHLVHAPSGRDVWIVLTLGRRNESPALSNAPCCTELRSPSTRGSDRGRVQ